VQLGIRGTAVSVGLIWSVLAMFLLGLTNLLWPGYGQAFLEAMASLYPGYGGLGQVSVGTLYVCPTGMIFVTCERGVSPSAGLIPSLAPI